MGEREEGGARLFTHLRDGHEVRFGVQTRQYQFLYRLRVQPPGGPPGPRRAPPPRHVSPPSSSSSSSSSLSSTRSFTSSVAAQSSSSSHSRKRKSGSGSGSESSPPSSSSKQQPPPTKRGRRISTPASTLPTGDHRLATTQCRCRTLHCRRRRSLVPPWSFFPSLRHQALRRPLRPEFSSPSPLFRRLPVPSQPRRTLNGVSPAAAAAAARRSGRPSPTPPRLPARKRPGGLHVSTSQTVAEMDCTSDGEQEDKDEKKDKQDNQRPSKQLKKSPRATERPRHHHNSTRSWPPR